MRLEIQCHQCGAMNKVPHYETNRTDYAKRFGADFEFRCRNCGYADEYEVDHIWASPQLFRRIFEKIVWIALFIPAIYLSLCFLPISLFFAPALLQVIFHGASRNHDMHKACNFNRHWFRRHYNLRFSARHSLRVAAGNQSPKIK